MEKLCNILSEIEEIVESVKSILCNSSTIRLTHDTLSLPISRASRQLTTMYIGKDSSDKLNVVRNWLWRLWRVTMKIIGDLLV